MMPPEMSAAQTIENFHLVFLATLQTRLDQGRYVLKGGANLRYFFDSDRYSEDIDLDAIAIEAWKLEAKVDQVLRSGSIALQLERAGLKIASTSKPKQTDTTQRWKLALSRQGREMSIRTKIEFSHRGTAGERRLDGVAKRVASGYGLRPPTVLHYLWGPALEQKIAALALRNETQARDVFDIELLLRRVPPGTPPNIDTEHIEAARELAALLPFEAFQDQVAPFLEPEIADQYDQQAWESMKMTVTEGLGEFL